VATSRVSVGPTTLAVVTSWVSVGPPALVAVAYPVLVGPLAWAGVAYRASGAHQVAVLRRSYCHRRAALHG
jgi:hypothetical protein